MLQWIRQNSWYLIGALAGGTGGFAYWKFVGCISGTCGITSQPVNSTAYFAVLGALLFGMFQNDKKAQHHPEKKQTS